MLGVILLFLILGIIIYQLSRKPDNFPPGPARCPILGNALLLKSKKMHLLAQDLKQRYGNVVGLYLFSKPLVLVSGLQEIREALAKPELQGRPMGAIREMENDKTGIIFMEGELWHEQRRFTLRHLRELGMGRHMMEDCIVEEARALMRDARRLAGDAWQRPVPVHELISASGVNIILQLLAGQRFDRLDPRMLELMAVVRSLTTTLDSTGGIANSFPFLLHYLPALTEYRTVKVVREKIRSYCHSQGCLVSTLLHGEGIREGGVKAVRAGRGREGMVVLTAATVAHPAGFTARPERPTCSQGIIKNHEENIDKKITEDLIYFYLQQMKADESEYFNTKQLIGLIRDLFVAGSDTTTGALAYGILNAVLNPNIQAKVQHELDTVVGKERLPTMQDKNRLPYSDATVQEILRFANVVPLGVPHSALTDTTFRGYFIPKGTRILLNLFHLHMDAGYWGDPHNFRPERFLDDAGKLRKDEALIPFGQGKRSCIGESLARTNLFVTFTALLQNFSLSLPEGHPRPSKEHIGGITFTTPPFSITMTPRNSGELY